MAEGEKTKIRTYRDLVVWQKAMSLVTKVYCDSGRFPKEEIYGLVAQIRRCAVSIPSNIAEGYGRNSTADYVRFLQIALGSVYELQTQSEISANLGYLAKSSFDGLLERSREIERMLSSPVRRIGNK